MKQEKGKKRELYNSSSSPKFTEEYTKEQNVDLINVHLDQSDDQFRMVNTGYFQKNVNCYFNKKIENVGLTEIIETQ